MTQDELKQAEIGVQYEIEKELKHRIKWAEWDFRWSHIFLWISILASFASSILVASDSKPFDSEITNRVIIAIIAGIPALVVAIEKSFDFARRAVWGSVYRVEIEELRDDLIFGKVDPYVCSKNFRKLKKQRELAFAHIGFFDSKNREANESQPTEGPEIEKDPSSTRMANESGPAEGSKIEPPLSLDHTDTNTPA